MPVQDNTCLTPGQTIQIIRPAGLELTGKPCLLVSPCQFGQPGVPRKLFLKTDSEPAPVSE
jgi:hypothetical protein